MCSGYGGRELRYDLLAEKFLVLAPVVVAVDVVIGRIEIRLHDRVLYSLR